MSDKDSPEIPSNNPMLQHAQLYSKDPVAAHDWDGTLFGGDGIFPTLLLTTTGRKTGEPRPTPLLYQPCGDGFIVIASNAGRDTHPKWYENLLAEPSCEVVAGKFSCRATARTISGETRVKYWNWMTRFWPAYTSYQSQTDRQLPVVILDVDAVLAIKQAN